MTIEIEGVETDESGDESKIHFNCSRDKFREVVHSAEEEINESFGLSGATIIREGKRNPVIKGPGDSKIYFKYNDGNSVASIGLASNDATDILKGVLNNMAVGSRESFGDYKERLNDELGDEGIKGGESVSPGRSPVEPDVKEPEDFQGQAGDQLDSENGPGTYEDVEFETVAEPEVGMETSFVPPHTKEEAEYKPPSGDPSSSVQCKNCVHYVEGGECKMVQGSVEPEAHCEELYSDFGFFGRADGVHAYINMAAWGEKFKERLGTHHIDEIVDHIEDAIMEGLR